MENSSNSGAIISSNVSAGGIVGCITVGNIENCSNSGNVTGRNQVGGIAGYTGDNSETGTIKINNCINTGNISTNNVDGRHGAGGIVGAANSVNLEIGNVYNSGTVYITLSSRTNNFGGGIVGYIIAAKDIKNAYNKGEVINEKTEGTIGAIAGLNDVSNSVSNCYYYLPQGSTLAGIGGTTKTGEGYLTGTEGNINYNYNSLNEFLRAIR